MQWFRKRHKHEYAQRLFLVVVCCLVVGATIATGQNAHASTPCPCHVFDATPSGQTVNNNGGPLELGIHFKVEADGYITGVRFYKDASMTDTHTGQLWGPSKNLLASGTFTNETTSGWQDLTFSSPVQVVAGTYYTASFYTPSGLYIATSNYFTSDVNNYPLMAPSSANATSLGLTGNDVFATTADTYPGNTFSNNNYWVDVTYTQTTDGSAPQVTATNPTNGSSNAYTNSAITATFNQNLVASSVSSSTVVLTDGSNNPITTTISYDDATKTITIQPASKLANKTTYVVSIRGGPSGVENLDGTPLAADYQWSFTTNDSCPCSIWGNGTLTDNPLAPTDTQTVELGQKIHADENGYIEALRFYKPINSTATTHTLHIWTTSGTLLGTATTSHESGNGWQEAPLASGVQITQGQDYVISYYSSDMVYAYSIGPLATQAGSGPLHADANSAIYLYGSDAFPTNSTGDSRTYWVDAVLTTSDTYTAPFTVTVSQPSADEYGVSTSAALTFHMSNAVDASTVSGAVTLKDSSGNTIAGNTAYNDSEHRVTFTSSQALSMQKQYTATVSGSLKDIYGTPLSTPYPLTFTTGSALSTNINQGMGGPVLVLTDSADPYDTYLAEILRTEGINYFTVKDVSQISSSTLNNYKMVLLGKSTLTASQVSVLTSWVQNGGNLIAMQPDAKLASLLGLTDKSQTLSEGYIKIDTSQAPGRGITAETMQYHGTADVYQNDSAQVVATLYQDATTATTDPAVTQKSVGKGHAGAFTYDLPRSIALTHQGNPAWAGQERDGNTPIRPDDLFYGGASTDWVNTSKAYIPQADEQQRLLVNMMLTMGQVNSPMPRYWILPHGYKAALILVGDDHGTAGGTFDHFGYLLNRSTANCSVADWQCERAGSFLYTSSGLTSTQANEMYARGFSMGVHISTNCANYTSYSNLDSDYTSQLSSFQSTYPGLPVQSATRTHCYVWSDWDSTPKADVANGVHYNMNYEWYPSTWTGSNTGYLTGSGFAMRFTDASGNMIDDFQGVTDLDYETDGTSTTMNTDLDNAIGSNAFYGVLGTHYDYTGQGYFTKLVAAAEAHNVPMISPDQMLTWKDGLDSSTFTNISSSASKLDFTVQVAQGAEGAQAMVPEASGSGSLTSIKQGSKTVSYTTSTVKGITYAVFDAQPGSYEALYGTQPTSSGSGTTSQASFLPSTGSAGSGAMLASITNHSPFSQQDHNKSQSGSGQNGSQQFNPSQQHGGSGNTSKSHWLGYVAGVFAVIGALVVTLRLRTRHLHQP